jgi:hypothetical protein
MMPWLALVSMAYMGNRNVLIPTVPRGAMINITTAINISASSKKNKMSEHQGS